VADTLHVNAPASFPSQPRRRCPTCATVTRHAVREYGWYDPTLTCCECGDSWSGGVRHERPFRRGWRKDAIARAEQAWAAAGSVTAADREAWFADQLSSWSWLAAVDEASDRD
jgi:hypothetical protein